MTILIDTSYRESLTMIVICGTVPIDVTKKEAALAAMKKMSEASEAEEGCLSYRFYVNPWDVSQVLIFEEWEDDAALQAHFQTPHMAEFNQQIPKYVTGEMAIKRYEVSEVSDL
jgi:quinol monooxygenase YgiN